MHILSTALVHAEESADATGLSVSPYVFGGVAFAALAVLLIVTLMIKVGD
jgi:hypothetical protein